MSATYEVHEGCTTLLSDEGYRRLADEQRMQRLEPLYAGGTIIGAAGVVLAIAGFVVAQILGAS
jgi:hypothetical protein